MTKFHFTLSIVLLFCVEAFSCGFVPETFCESTQLKSTDVIISGTILSIDEDGLDLEVLDVIRGVETKNVIRIWDGTDFECNGPWSMDCSSIGNVGETVILLMPEITEIENTWDVIGDYRRPNPYSYTSQLKVENGVATGLIAGDALQPDEFNVMTAEYANFVEAFNSDGNCDKLASSNDTYFFDLDIKYTNPIQSTLNLQCDDAQILGVNIYSLQGEQLEQVSYQNVYEVSISLDHYVSGLYIVEVLNSTNQAQFIKIVKQ